jgi:hypothetical protein
MTCPKNNFGKNYGPGIPTATFINALIDYSFPVSNHSIDFSNS